MHFIVACIKVLGAFLLPFYAESRKENSIFYEATKLLFSLGETQFWLKVHTFIHPWVRNSCFKKAHSGKSQPNDTHIHTPISTTQCCRSFKQCHGCSFILHEQQFLIYSVSRPPLLRFQAVPLSSLRLTQTHWHTIWAFWHGCRLEHHVWTHAHA